MKVKRRSLRNAERVRRVAEGYTNAKGQSIPALGGGFQFCRPAGEVSIAAIIEAVDGPIALTQCQHPSDGVAASDCSIGSSCSVRGHWAPINRAVRDALSAVTLADLIQPVVAREGVPA